MHFIGSLIVLLARGFKWVGTVFDRCSNVLHGILPALLTPSQLSRLVRDHYDEVYVAGFLPANLESADQGLEFWETKLFDRHRIHSGRLLVMGAGWGREGIAAAQRGLTVVGIDTSAAAMRTANHLAKVAGVSACFHQADYTALPYARASFDAALLSAIMYSAVPGVARRQAWIVEIGRVLKPGGLAILSFLREQPHASLRRNLCMFLCNLLLKLPGTNQSYQPGDTCYQGHFYHEFHDPVEIRDELTGAGVLIQELNWVRGFAVVSFPMHTEKAPNS